MAGRVSPSCRRGLLLRGPGGFSLVYIHNKILLGGGFWFFWGEKWMI
jgi:hypothetical protein